jgi:Fe-S oxidoreductase/nitrate reductase gamma subunit
MYALFCLVLLAGGWAVVRRAKGWRSGRPEREDRFDEIGWRIADLLEFGLLQARVSERVPSGLFHAMIFGGFLVLTVATILVAVQHDLGILILDGRFYLVFKVLVDGFGLLLLAGCAGALLRRAFFPSPGHLRGPGEILPVALLAFTGATGFLVEILRLAATRPDAASASWLSNLFVPLFSDSPPALLVDAHRYAWWLHLATAFGFLALVPFSKMFHLASAPVSILLRTSRPNGALQTVPNIEEEASPGVLAVTDFSWKQLFSAEACTRCGRCQDDCPAFAASMPLSPRDVVLKTTAALHAGAFASPLPPGSLPPCEGDAFAREILTPGAIWACTTCRACVRACPVAIEHVDMIVDVRRGFVADGRIPEGARVALRKMGDTGNPWGMPQADRFDWAEGLDVPLASACDRFEYLYWVGCAASYDPRNRKVARALVTLLKRAGVDFAVLGPEEGCCGESARRLGDEGLFQLGAVATVKETFARYGVTKVITGCPHCFNTFRNEYPPLGVTVEVVHHASLLSALLESGRLKPSPAPARPVAFHDSCYLGRYNGLFDAPRHALGAVPGISIVEAARHRDASFCCGAGGGAMWMELPGQRINHLRFGQLRETGARAIASACPYCLAMFDDAIKFHDLGDSFEARDIAEYLADAIAADSTGKTSPPG